MTKRRNSSDKLEAAVAQEALRGDKTDQEMAAKIANKDTESIISGLIKSAQKLSRELYKSLTWDRAKELADHPRFTLATDVDVYFCDPQSTWQRGSNENTNRLLRQYLPRGTDLSALFASKTQRNRKAT